jgi:Fis family transcriptional regulator
VDKRPASESDPASAADATSRHRLRESVRIATERYLRALGEEPPGDLYRLLLAEVEPPLIEAVLRHYRGNQTRAAQALGISRVTLRKKLKQFNGDGR